MRGWIGGVTLAALLAAAPAFGVAEEAAPEAPAVDPEALALLKRATDHLTSADRIRFRIRTLYDVVQESGQKLQFGTWDEAIVRRPDRAAATFRRDDGTIRRVYYDGGSFTVYDTKENAYGQFPVPDTLDEMLDYLELEVGAPLPLADLFYSDLSHLGDAALEGEVVGTSRVVEHECDHLAFRGETVDWQVWIDREEPVLRKIVITYRELPSEPQFGAVFLEWDFGPEAPDRMFSFVPPEGAERIPTVARPGDTQIQGPR